MLFSSPVFLFLFLPLALLGYFLSPKAIKNYWLLLVSLVFFAWGGVSYSLILIVSVIINYFFGLAIARHRGSKSGYGWTAAGVTINILILAIFKYTDFLIANINRLFHSAALPYAEIILPVGISFYTFHSLSYLIDIHRGKTGAQKNIFDLALYICMFPQLVAGPIIRYNDVWLQLRGREHTPSKFASGIERFIIGLGKKVLLANTFARVADDMFATNATELGMYNAWLGMICYTLQIYCDFAGYSDMAIGLGRMFGFEFKENFNFPYIATSIKEFWRRWHISLSSFFRDYVYIPLGGNKGSKTRTYLNLITVFFLTGFWHGASWSFIVWGLFHGAFMLLERTGLEKLLEKTWKPVAVLYTLLVVMFAWVLFRADTLGYAMDYWKALLSPGSNPQQTSRFLSSLNTELIITLIITLAGSFGVFNRMYSSIQNILQQESASGTIFAWFYHSVCLVFYAGVLALCGLYLIAGTYNPFIYYKF